MNQLRSLRYVLVCAMGLMWGCGGEKMMQSQMVEGEEQVGRPLSKLAVQTNASVVATVLRDDTPVIGSKVEFARSIAGQVADYQWSEVTDANGQVRVELGTGYYQARASLESREIGSWSSIPINGGYEVMLNLPIGEKARVVSASPQEIPIGVVLPVNLGSIYISLKNGMELAREEVNRSQLSATPISFIFEDSESNPDLAVSAFSKLIDQDRVPVILGPGFSSSSAAAFPIAQEKQVVAFSPTAGASGLGAIGNFIFRVPSPVDKAVPSFVSITRKKLGYQKVAIIVDRDDLYSNSGYEETKKALGDLGVEILTTETFQTGDTDFSEQLIRIKASNPDVIFVWTRPAERVEIPVQGRQLGIPDAIPFLIFGFTSTEIEMAGTAAEGIITSAYWSLSANTPGNRDFVQNYRTKYGTDPDTWAALGYVNVHVLAGAIKNSESANSGAIRDALAAIDVPTILGQFSFDPEGDPTYPGVVVVVANGEFEIFDKQKPDDRAFEVVRPTGDLQPYSLSPIVSVESVRSMPTGTPVFLRTEFANGQLADLEMTFIQVVDDFLPPMPVYMLEASDPVLIQLGGIAKGMSGSPVFTEQGTWGAIAYGFNQQDSPPYYFFATPIEWVIGIKGAIPLAKRLTTWAGNGITPLAIPLLGTGFNPNYQMNDPHFQRELTPAGRSAQNQDSFEAGRPLAVALMLGEVTVAGLGTISYVSGNRIYGFGHPMDGSGAVSLPIIEAVVLGPISNLSAPYKFATLNPTVRGTLTEDRLPAVRGVLGENPELIPLKSVYTFPSGYVLELTHNLAMTDPSTVAGLVEYALFSPLGNRIENEPNHSVRVRTNISFVETNSKVTQSRLYAEPNGYLLPLIGGASFDLARTLSELMTRDDYALQMREGEVHVDILPESRFAKIVSVNADTVISAGSTISVRTSLRVGRREDREIEMAFSIPDTLPAGVYQLEVGSAATLGSSDGNGDGLFEVLFNVEGSDETLEDVFARVNRIDENVILKAQLTSAGEGGMVSDNVSDSSSGSDSGSDSFPGPDSFPGNQQTTASVSIQKEVDLFLVGSQTLRVRVVGN